MSRVWGGSDWRPSALLRVAFVVITVVALVLPGRPSSSLVVSHRVSNSQQAAAPHAQQQVFLPLQARLPARDGSDGDLVCDCNVGNVNNMLIVCKVCSAFAYALNRRLHLLPWCEQHDFEQHRNHSCVAVDTLFSLVQLSRLVPTFALAPSSAGDRGDAPAVSVEPLRCDKDAAWSWVSDFAGATLEEIASKNASFHQPVCVRPSWKHAWADKCNGDGEFGLQLDRQLYRAVATYWLPSNKVDVAVEAVKRRMGGAYLAVHVRRSQSWLPGEMAAWSTGWPDVSLSMEHILQLLRHEVGRCLACRGRVFMATNSRNDTELALLAGAAPLRVERFAGTDTDAMGLSPMQQVLAELALLGHGEAMLGTPGSTFLENTRHVMMMREAPARVATFCQYRAELPALWPPCVNMTRANDSALCLHARPPGFSWATSR